MKKIAMVSLVLSSLSGVSMASDPVAPAGESSVSSSVRAEIKDAIPGAVPKSTKSIYYPEPGKINISAVQYCGDGDVATFAQQHPNWQHQESASMPVVLGYWVVPEGASELPTAANYFALGTTNVPVGGSYISTFNPSNADPADASKKMEMYKSAMDSIKAVAGAKSYAMGTGAGSGDKFKMYLGAMMCKTIKDQGKYDVLPAIASAAMANDVYNILDTAATSAAGKSSWSSIRGDMRARLSVRSNGGFSAEADTGPVDLDGPIADLAERVHDFDLPNVDTSLPIDDQLKNFQKAFADASFADKLRRLGDALDSNEKCSSVGNGVSAKEKFSWEPYPLQLTCKALNGGTYKGLSNASNTFLNPPKVWTSAEFKERKKAVVKLLLAGAQMQNAQSWVENKVADNDSGWRLPKQRCFDAKPYIDYTMQSIVIQIPTVSSADYTPIHPEGDFAIGGSAPYYSDDMHTIFGMTTPGTTGTGLSLTRGVTATAPNYMPETMRLNMKVRGIGCNTNIYCQNQYGPHANTKHL